MSSMLMRHTSFDEIVEDSEPEREEIRRRSALKTSTSRISTPIIELTDSDSSLSPPSLRPPSPPFPAVSIADHGRHTRQPVSLTGSKLKHLQQFSFQDPGPPLSRPRTPQVLTPVPVPSTSKPAPTKPKPRRKNSPEFDIAIRFPDKITYCPCCQSKWTVRKSATQKLQHIKSCAKQQRLTEDTIQTLIEQQIAAFDPVKDRLSTAPAPVSAPVQRSLMGELVSTEVTKKTKKRAQATVTVLPLDSQAEARLREQARAVLAPRSPSNKEPVAEEAFAPSRLSSSTSSRPSIFVSHLDDLPDNLLPNTSPLPPEAVSRLVALGWLTDGTFAGALQMAPVASEDEGPPQIVAIPKKKRTKRAKKDDGPASDPLAWQVALKEAITSDEDLYQRILRYETIDFEVFLKMAQECAPQTTRLKEVLRNFLDDQAILFTIPDAQWGKKRS